MFGLSFLDLLKTRELGWCSAGTTDWTRWSPAPPPRPRDANAGRLSNGRANVGDLNEAGLRKIRSSSEYGSESGVQESEFGTELSS